MLIGACALTGVAFVAHAETADEELTNADLHELVLDLTERVEKLENDLASAKSTIAGLEDKLTTSNATSDKKYRAIEKRNDVRKNMRKDKAVSKREWSDERGKSLWDNMKVRVCYKSKTMHVSARAALAYKKEHGAVIGSCPVSAIKDETDKEDTDNIDDDDDDDGVYTDEEEESNSSDE